jgi:hypothetical protein
MRKMHKLGKKKPHKNSTVSNLRRDSLPTEKSTKPSGLQVEKIKPRNTQADAIASIISLPLPGEGFTLTALGMPRSGKSYFAKRLVDRLIEMDQVVLIHDPKKPTSYTDGFIHRMMSPIDVSPDQANQAVDLDPDALASTALLLARDGAASCLVIDEATRALGAPQRFIDGGHLKLLYSEGASQGCTTILLSQCPQWLPRECCDLVTATVIFRLAGRSLTAVEDLYRLSTEQTETIQRLQNGQCILITPYAAWDHIVYGPT